MDILTLVKAKKYAKALVDALEGEVDEGLKDISDLKDGLAALDDDLEGLDSDLTIVNADGDTASKLIINALRQHMWKNEEEAPLCEEGTVTLTNTRKYPFNDSKKTVALANRQRNTKYAIVAEVTSEKGWAGEISVSDKAVNGFKMAFDGGAKQVAVKYYVIGGMIQ